MRPPDTIAFPVADSELVSFSKLGRWYLLLYVSFASVSLIYRRQQPFTDSLANKAQPPPG